jgi:hypothetical protein
VVPTNRVDTAPAIRQNGAVGGSLEVRISDADRNRVVERLREAYAEGRISLDELHERVDLAFGALTKQDVVSITKDLPKLKGRHGPPQSRFRPPRLFLKVNAVLWAIWGAETLSGHAGTHDLWPLVVTVPWAALVVIERTLPRRSVLAK